MLNNIHDAHSLCDSVLLVLLDSCIDHSTHGVVVSLLQKTLLFLPPALKSFPWRAPLWETSMTTTTPIPAHLCSQVSGDKKRWGWWIATGWFWT